MSDPLARQMYICHIMSSDCFKHYTTRRTKPGRSGGSREYPVLWSPQTP